MERRQVIVAAEGLEYNSKRKGTVGGWVLDENCEEKGCAGVWVT